MVAMFHDYRIMNPHKGFLCLNELDLGVPLRPPMLSVFKQKVSTATLRQILFEAVRFKVRPNSSITSTCYRTYGPSC